MKFYMKDETSGLEYPFNMLGFSFIPGHDYLFVIQPLVDMPTGEQIDVKESMQAFITTSKERFLRQNSSLKGILMPKSFDVQTIDISRPQTLLIRFPELMCTEDVKEMKKVLKELFKEYSHIVLQFLPDTFFVQSVVSNESDVID